MAETESRTARLRPPEFEVDCDAPFAADRLNREESVKSLCSTINSAQLPLVVSVEGAYGTGKSAFLRMCAAQMEKLGASTVEFNAWQQGHTGRPLIDLVAALTTKLHDKGRWDKLQETAKQVGWRLARVASRGVFDRNDAEDASVFDEWISVENGIADFKMSLREQVENLQGELVILVDELDRCEPLYALDLLNKARHLFDISGVCMVFGVNRQELGHAVQTLYGPTCDVDGYLQRFVDLSVQLRQPTADEWAAYLAGIFEYLPDSSEILKHETYIAHGLLIFIAENSDGRLRHVEHVVRHANLVLKQPDRNSLWPLWIVVMLALRYIDRSIYEQFASGQMGVWDVLDILRDRMPRNVTLPDHVFLDVAVLGLGLNDEVPRDREQFIERYMSIRPDEAGAIAAFEELNGRRWRSGRTQHNRVVERLYNAIELATSAQPR